MDEIQLCNPIGPYNHKVVQVYFSLGNIPGKFRSRYHSINLLAIFHNDQVELFGLDEILRPIVEAITQLKDGVEFEVNGKKETFYGTDTAIVGDNLSSHLVGGFKAGFSKGFRKCRTCLGVPEDIQTKFFDCEFII